MEAWAPVFGKMGTLCVSVINFTPIPGFYGVWKSKEVKYVPHTFFLLLNLNSLLWLSMGLANGLGDVIRSNAISMFFTISYLAVYHIVKGDLLSFMPIYLTIAVLLGYSLVTYVPPQFITAIAGVVNSLMAISPFENVKKVIREQNSKYIDIIIMGCSLPTSFSWMMYGICIGAVPMVIPNVLGVVSSSILIVLYFMYRAPKQKST